MEEETLTLNNPSSALSALSGLTIAHLIEGDGPGGAEQVVAHLARGFQRAGTRNIVVVPPSGEGWLGRQLEDSGVIVEWLDLSGRASLRHVRELSRLLRRYDVAVAHSHEFAMGVFGTWASRRIGAGHVLTMHGGRYYAERLRRRLALRASGSASGCFVAVSDSLRAHLSRDLWMRRARISVVPNGVAYQPPREGTLRRELGLSDGHKLGVSVGNLYAVKGHRFLVDAVAELAESHREVHVAIAGRGKEEAALREQAQQLGIADRVHLLGLRDDVNNVLASGDFFVLPSLSEGLPLALLEAMFAGLPIVATAVGDVASALADGAAGLLVPPRDAHALAEQVRLLLSQPSRARQLGAAAAARAEGEFGISRMIERYAGIYSRLVRTHTGGR